MQERGGRGQVVSYNIAIRCCFKLTRVPDLGSLREARLLVLYMNGRSRIRSSLTTTLAPLASSFVGRHRKKIIVTASRQRSRCQNKGCLLYLGSSPHSSPDPSTSRCFIRHVYVVVYFTKSSNVGSSYQTSFCPLLLLILHLHELPCPVLLFISCLMSSLILAMVPTPPYINAVYTCATLALASSTSSTCLPVAIPSVEKMTLRFGGSLK